MINLFTHLPIDEDIDEIIIENDKQCRNKKKLLDRKIEKDKINPSKELSKQIISLKSAIQDYETKDVVHKNIYKKEPSVKSKDDETSVLLNRLSKQHRKLKNKQEAEDQQYNSKKKKTEEFIIK